MSNVKTNNGFSNNAFVKKVGTQKLIVLMAIVILYTIFALASESFFQYSTLVSVIENSYYIGFMAIGVTFCLITGGVDLSIGTGMIAYSLVGAYLTSSFGLPWWAGLLVTLVLGIIIGTLNGFLVAVMNLPPFIATLCTMMITRGTGSIITTGLSASWSAEFPFKKAFRMSVDGTLIPLGLIYIIIAVVVMTIVLNKTKVGRYIIGIGSNKEALRLSGVNVVKWQWIAYVISGFFAGLAGIAYAGIFSTSIPPGGGAGLELSAIGGAIIGGTSMTGGEGSIVGTILGVYVMVLLQVGLPFVGLQSNWQQIITACVLILAVTIDVMKRKK